MKNDEKFFLEKDLFNQYHEFVEMLQKKLGENFDNRTTNLISINQTFYALVLAQTLIFNELTGTDNTLLEYLEQLVDITYNESHNKKHMKDLIEGNYDNFEGLNLDGIVEEAKKILNKEG